MSIHKKTKYLRLVSFLMVAIVYILDYFGMLNWSSIPLLFTVYIGGLCIFAINVIAFFKWRCPVCGTFSTQLTRGPFLLSLHGPWARKSCVNCGYDLTIEND